MKAQSEGYITLQTIYRKKAHSDLAEVTRSVRQIEEQLGRKLPIESKEIEAFCKGAAFVKLVRGRKLVIDPIRLGWNNSEKTVLNNISSDFEVSLLPTFIAIAAMDACIDLLQPTTSPRDLLTRFASEKFTSSMTTYISEVFSRLQNSDVSAELDEPLQRALKIAEEIQRSGPFELHNISSMTGGMVAQEIIKIITKQYVPVDNTCLLDGIQSITKVYKL
jgi:NEDD8-activating enzyme E1 regulatory subunit